MHLLNQDTCVHLGSSNNDQMTSLSLNHSSMNESDQFKSIPINFYKNKDVQIDSRPEKKLSISLQKKNIIY